VFVHLPSLLEREDVAVAGPLLVTQRGPQPWDHGELRGLRARITNEAGHAYCRPRTAPTEAAWVSGAFMAIRRDAFGDAGGFDETYFLYKEEEDLCLQVRRSGRKVIYDPRVIVIQVGSVGRRATAPFARATEHFTSRTLHALWQWRLSRAIHVGFLRHP
jgi:GT2 family glycosyltransferase